jgi:hypothetical protein
LLLFAGGFTRLDNYRQLIAMAGLSPREHTSEPASAARYVSLKWVAA